MKKIVVIGGGTGTYTVLKGLKKYPVELSAIVTMTDSGGSNRVIRDEFGLLPTSDLRQCIVALASENSNGLIRELFTYRYSQGTGIAGMSFGNLFMAALTDIFDSQKIALQKTCELMQVQGKILPVTYEKTNLVARYENGKQVLGEHYIDEPDEDIGSMKIVELEVFPKVRANKDALDAIKNAHLIVFGPGDLFTSILCNVMVGEMASCIKESCAKKLFVMNLMTKFGQTNSYTATDHIAEFDKYLGRDVLDYCLVNKTTKYSKILLEKYKEEHAKPVVDDLKNTRSMKVVRKNMMANEIFKKHRSDKLVRSLIRHDSDKLAKEIFKLL